MRAYPLPHAPRYEEEVGCRANAENEFVALKKVRHSKESMGSSVWSHVFSRIPTPAPATSQTALPWLKLLIQTTFDPKIKSSSLQSFDWTTDY